MGLLEPITHKEEIESLVNDAQRKYDDATKRLEEQKERTSRSLERLGEQKLEAWSGDMQDFLDIFNLYNNVQMVNKKSNLVKFAGQNEKPQELMINMQRASMTATEVLKTGALAIGTGALVGIASYGGAMMFAHASTGTAIAALSGAAKTNATLAWFGGGSLAAGGLGKLGGKLVLGGIVVAPILLVAGVITAAKSKEKLAEAKKMHAEAEKAVAQMNTIISGMEGIEKMSENYRHFLSNLSSLFRPFVSEMERISQDYTPGPDGKIDFDDLSEVEQKTLHLSWLLAQLYYHGLSATILTEDGNVAPEAKTVLSKSEKEYLAISGEVAKLNKEKEEIRQLLATARTSFDSACKNYFDKKLNARISLIDFGRKKVELGESSIRPYVEKLSAFEDVGISNTLHYAPFCEDTASIFETIEQALTATRYISENGNNAFPDSTLIEVAAFEGLSFLATAAQQQDVARFLMEADKHDLSIWLAEEMDPIEEEHFSFAGMSAAQINAANAIVSGISGKENLTQAKNINATVNDIVSKMNSAAEVSAAFASRINKGLECNRQVEKVLKPFVVELENFAKKYSENQDSIVPFEQLTEAEQKVVEMSWNLAKLQYYILNASVLPNDQEGSQSIDATVTEVQRELKLLRKETFKMTGVCTMAADLIWKPYAQKMMFANFAAMLLFVAIGIMQMINSNWYGLIGLAGAVIALPIFFYYKNLPQSKLYMWRIIRLAIALIVFVGVQMIGLVSIYGRI